MFYRNRITKIKDTDVVLEIGPGGDPYERSDVFLEVKLPEKEYVRQAGNVKSVIEDGKVADKKVFYYEDANPFPFEDKQFDYVIASHVIEHVTDLTLFVSELARVAKRGYLEFPTIFYEYVYNIPEHNFVLQYKDSTLIYMQKAKLGLEKYQPINAFFMQTLTKTYTQNLNDLLQYYIQGFEWEGDIKIKEVNNFESVIPDYSDMTIKKIVEQDESLKRLLGKFVRKVIKK